jgi:hypothetical protein
MSQASKSHVRERARHRLSLVRFVVEHGIEIRVIQMDEPLVGFSASVSGRWVGLASDVICGSSPTYAGAIESAREWLAGPGLRVGSDREERDVDLRFNVAAVRRAAQALLKLEPAEAVFRDWTRTLGKDPENRKPGAFAKPLTAKQGEVCERSFPRVEKTGTMFKSVMSVTMIGGWPGHLAAKYEAAGLGPARVANGAALAKCGRRILAAIEGQPSECQVCNGLGVSMGGPSLFGSSLFGVGPEVCDACNGTGENLRGRLPILLMTRQVYRRACDSANRRPQTGRDDWLDEIRGELGAEAFGHVTRHHRQPPPDVGPRGRQLYDQINWHAVFLAFRSQTPISDTQHDAHVQTWIRWNSWPAHERGEVLQAQRRERIAARRAARQPRPMGTRELAEAMGFEATVEGGTEAAVTRELADLGAGLRQPLDFNRTDGRSISGHPASDRTVQAILQPAPGSVADIRAAILRRLGATIEGIEIAMLGPYRVGILYRGTASESDVRAAIGDVTLAGYEYEIERLP